MLDLREPVLLWPLMLWLLLIVPLLVVLYVRMLVRQKRTSLPLASMSLLEARPGEEQARVGGLRGKWLARRHHVPAVLLLLGIASMIFAISRPQAIVMLPTRMDAVMLAMDVSGSMKATDVKPNRLVAAQEAAKVFIADQPIQVRIGVVEIAATAAVVQSPTDKREDVVKAIDRFQIRPGTALGSGLVIALATLLPEGGIDVEKAISGNTGDRWTRDPARLAEIANFKPVPPGSNGTTAIVLLTDGESNTGPAFVESAKLAAERGVRVYTVGIGTTQGTTITADGWSMRVRLDEDALKKVADMTHGEYFRAGNARELKKIYQHLSARLTMGRGRATELTSVFIGLGALFMMLAALLSLLWFNRIL